MDDGMLVHVIDRGKIHVLNSGAADVFERCNDTRSIDDIVDDIATATSTSTSVVRKDVSRVLAEFVRLGLLEADEQ